MSRHRRTGMVFVGAATVGACVAALLFRFTDVIPAAAIVIAIVVATFVSLLLLRRLVLAATVAAVAAIGAVLLWLGRASSGWRQEYAPNLFASLVELTIGALLVKWYVDLLVARRRRPLHQAAGAHLEQALGKFLFVLQVMYVESTQAAPPSIPATREELLEKWPTAFPHLDLLQQPVSLQGYQRWMDLLADAATELRDDLARIQQRFADTFDDALTGSLAQLEVDPMVRFWIDLPSFPQAFGTQTLPHQVSAYYPFQRMPGGVLANDFIGHVREAANRCERLPSVDLAPDPAYYMTALAHWGASYC